MGPQRLHQLQGACALRGRLTYASARAMAELGPWRVRSTCTLASMRCVDMVMTSASLK